MKNKKNIRNNFINKSSSKYSKFVKDFKNRLENLIPISKSQTHFKKEQSLDQIITVQDLFDFFQKGTSMRSKREVINYAKYLSENYQYFKKIKAEDSQLKVEQITKICRIETKSKNESIINFGEIGDKFYIVLEGVVEIYRPKYIDIEVYPSEFLKMLNKVKTNEKNLLKYERIKEKNKIFFDTYSQEDPINNISMNVNLLKNKQVFLMEDEEKLGEYGEGFSFGAVIISLILCIASSCEYVSKKILFFSFILSYFNKFFSLVFILFNIFKNSLGYTSMSIYLGLNISTTPSNTM